MHGAAKRKSITPAGLTALRVLLLLIVTLFLPQTRVWGFENSGRHASGVFAAALPVATGENDAGWRYDVPDSSFAAEATTTLYRAVGPAELADINATQAIRNLGSAEGKYFTSSAEHAADYAKQAVNAFKDPPYTIIKTEVPTSSLPIPVSVDRGIPAYVVPNGSLPGLKPTVLETMPIPRTR